MFIRILIGGAVTLVAVTALGAFAAGAFSDDAENDPAEDTPIVVAPGETGTTPQSPPAQDLNGMQRVPAPIEEASIDSGQGGGKFILRGVAGLPGGCAEPAGYEIQRREGVIDVDVYILVPADDRPCTKIYGTYELAIDLGTDIRQETTVDVNGTLLPLVP